VSSDQAHGLTLASSMNRDALTQSRGLSFFRSAVMVWDMSTKAEAILKQFEMLPPAEKQVLWRELQRRVAPVELHGEPLTDEDIAGSARVTFVMLDEEEQPAKVR
jgi:hypothetical protein